VNITELKFPLYFFDNTAFVFRPISKVFCQVISV